MANLDKIRRRGNNTRGVAGIGGVMLGAALWGLSTIAHGALSHDPALSWKVLHSEHFAVHYHDGEEALARETIAIAEQVHARLSAWLQWTPAEPVDVVLTDEMDLSNGFATPIPGNHMTLFVAPPDDLPLEDHAGWLETLITHEYTHILHLDKARGVPNVLRKIFGRFPLLFPLLPFTVFPNAWQPTWLIEGLATYVETDTARGIGRGQSSYADMIMRMEVENGVKPIHQVNQPISTWPGGSTPYFYGVQFYNFIAERYGEDKIQRLVNEYSDDAIPFFINRNSKKIFRRNLNDMWDEFGRYLDNKYKPKLAAIREQGVRTGLQLTRDGYFGGGVRALPDDTVFYIRNDGRSKPFLMVWRPGAKVPEELHEVHHDARLDVHPTAGVLLVQIELRRNSNYYSDIYWVDPKRGSLKRLTHGARYRAASWGPNGDRIMAVHHARGVNSLHLLDTRGKLLETVWSGIAGEVIADFDWSPDGSVLVAAVWRRTQGWNLERFTLADRRWESLTHDAAIEMQPQFTPDGGAVLFTSDHGGVYNLRRLDLNTGRVTTLTNVLGGAFSPAPAIDGAVYYSGYGAHGFDLYRLASSETLPTPAAPPGPSAVAAAPAPEPAGLATTDYSPWASLRPRWWFPHIVSDGEQEEIGVITSGRDLLQRHEYVLDIAYDWNNQEFVGAFDYFYDRWFPLFKLHASRTNTFHYKEDETPLELERKRHADRYQAEMVLPFLYYDNQIGVHLTALQHRDEDDVVAPGVTPEVSTRDNILGVGVTYDSTKYHPLSISRANGRHISLIGEDSDALEGDFTGNVYTLDWREFFSLGAEHVLAARVVGGYGTDAPRPFELGGSASAINMAAVQAIIFNPPLQGLFDQREYPLRGYPTGRSDLIGRRMLLGSLEWRFPIARIERGAMVPFPIGADKIWGSLFVDSGAAWDAGDHADRYSTGAGAEVYTRVVLFYWLPLDVRVGLAKGRDAGGERQGYLRVGTSF